MQSAELSSACTATNHAPACYVFVYCRTSLCAETEEDARNSEDRWQYSQLTNFAKQEEFQMKEDHQPRH